MTLSEHVAEAVGTAHLLEERAKEVGVPAKEIRNVMSRSADGPAVTIKRLSVLIGNRHAALISASLTDADRGAA